MNRFMAVLGVVVALSGLATFAQQVGPALDPSKVIDLTYNFDEHTIYWPNAQAFHWEKQSWGPSPGGFWYAAGRYGAAEHGGTHLDSPIHFAQGKQTLDEVPVSRLIAPALVVDITRQCETNRDYLLSVSDIAALEKAHGKIPEGAILVVRTGWGRFWPNKKLYLGDDTPGDIMHLHFPGISKAAAEVLAERKIAGVGIDTASMDYGPSTDFQAHRVLNGANIYGLENLANLDRLPVAGAWIIALPMKIKGGSGGPTRVVALLP